MPSLAEVLASIDLPADWIGIRGIREAVTRRTVRDGHPEDNVRSLDQGAMVEVLANGQFGYAATNRLTPEALRAA
ncbi:MAG TPA: DNA gyrase modulator, partial [Trichocoleus sp.]